MAVDSITTRIVNLLGPVSMASRPDDLVTPFSEAISAFGFAFVCYLTLRSNFRNNAYGEAIHLRSNFADIDAMVEGAGRIDFDPVFLDKVLKTKPFHLFQAGAGPASDRADAPYHRRLRRHDIVDVVCVPVSAEVGDIGVFFLSARGVEFHLDQLGKTALHVICDAVHRRHGELKNSNREIAPIAMSQREQDVADLMAEGKTNKEIAGVLRISAHTVDTYIRRIFEKIGVNNRIEAAVRYALVEGLSPIR
ncbi:MAG: helix-turn-helix transcriptional regulator [Parvularculaceae bacterium]